MVQLLIPHRAVLSGTHQPSLPESFSTNWIMLPSTLKSSVTPGLEIISRYAQGPSLFAPHLASQSPFPTTTSPWTLSSTFSGLLRDTMFLHTPGLCTCDLTLWALLISLASPSCVPSPVEPSVIFQEDLIASPLYSQFCKTDHIWSVFIPHWTANTWGLATSF